VSTTAEDQTANRLISTDSPSGGAPADVRDDWDRVRAMKKELEDAGVAYCYASYVDIHGVPKAKCVPIGKFEKMCGGSELFTVGAMEGMGLAGPHEDECAVVPELDTGITLPWASDRAWFTGQLYYHGEPYPSDSRVILKRMVDKAAERGYRVNLGFEPEFYVLRGNDGAAFDTLSDTYYGLCPAYDVHATEQAMPYLDRMRRYMDSLGWNVYSFDQEGGHGQYEFDFGFTDILRGADQFVFFRLMAKQAAKEIGAHATFMPKPFPADFRSGAHFNISFEDIETGENLFAPGKERDAMAQRYGIDFSRRAFNCAAGMIRHGNALTAVTCPRYNSYQGLIAQGDMPDQSWAPVINAYGSNNRSSMLRLPANRHCIENRAPDMSCNPYLAAALHIGAALEGLEHDMDPGEPVNENAYELKGMSLREKREALLPKTMLHALEAFDDDPLTREVFGDFKDIFLNHKIGEWETAFYEVNECQRRNQLWFI
jgi:glutamine synthetase